MDPGKSTNRTVYTFVGSADAVVQAALQSAKTAYQLIDMTTHSGEHPRLGALDVCPFIPVRNAKMEDCVECANRFSRLLAEELKVPGECTVFKLHIALSSSIQKSIFSVFIWLCISEGLSETSPSNSSWGI